MFTYCDLPRRSLRRIGALILLLCLGARFDVATLRAERHQDAALTGLLRQALVAVNAHDPRRVALYADAGAQNAFGWVAETTTHTWQADLLRLPPMAGRSAGGWPSAPYLAVFHAWHTCQSDGDHVHLALHTDNGWRLGPEIPETATGGFRVRDHDLGVTFDIATRTARITDRARIERTVQSIPAFCLLRLSQDFRVRECRVEGAAVPMQQAGGVLLFAPPATRTFTVELSYSGEVNHRGSDYILADEATLNSYWYVNIARLPATSTVTVTQPPGWTAIAQGDLVERKPAADGGLRLTYRNDLPNSFFTVDMGRYHLTTRQAEGRTLTAYLLRDDPAFAAGCLDRLQKALAFYDSHFARFPYTHYGIVETRGPFDGALEAYSFATFEAGELPGSIAHELSHTWWGGLIPCTYTRSMWDEAFAVYSDGLFSRLDRKQNGEEAYSGRKSAHGYGNAFDAVPLASAFDTSDAHQAAVGYDKGGRVMRILEEQLGQEGLLRCLRAFLAGHPRGEAGSWDEFERVVNRTTQQDLGWFFKQWLDRTGLPTLRLTHVNVQPDAGGYRVEADIAQSGPTYRLKVPILLRTRSGDSLTAVEATGPITHLSLHAPAAPTEIVLDPGGVLPLTSAEGLNYDFKNL